MWSLKAWGRRRARSKAWNEALWQSVVSRFSFLRSLNADERNRLRELTRQFLETKQMNGAAGLELSVEMRLVIAAQACLPVLNLGLAYYRDWVEVIVYPGDFVPEREYMDKDGLVHSVREPMQGEAWLKGSVILSWEAAETESGEGVNVVIHEFAHKIDMLNGKANGFPPLHAEMSRTEWVGAFSRAYEDFCARVGAGEDTAIDPYAAESPAEFFAVLSEVFFEAPSRLVHSYPKVYRQLAAFYRQDPAARANQTS